MRERQIDAGLGGANKFGWQGAGTSDRKTGNAIIAKLEFALLEPKDLIDRVQLGRAIAHGAVQTDALGRNQEVLDVEFDRRTIGCRAFVLQDKAAAGKLEKKGLDMVVANDVTREDAGFESDTNRVCLLMADGAREDLPTMDKDDVATEILCRVERLACGTSAT